MVGQLDQSIGKIAVAADFDWLQGLTLSAYFYKQSYASNYSKDIDFAIRGHLCNSILQHLSSNDHGFHSLGRPLASLGAP